MRIRKILNYDIPEEFSHSLKTSQAYIAGVLRAREPEKLMLPEFKEVRVYDNKFKGRIHEVLVEYVCYYEKVEGLDCVEQARAYSRGTNIDRKLPGKFDPKKLSADNKPWSAIRGEPHSFTHAGPDSYVIMTRIDENPAFFPWNSWDELEFLGIEGRTEEESEWRSNGHGLVDLHKKMSAIIF